MNRLVTITWHGSPMTIALSVLVLLITAGLCWVAWRRSGYARWTGGLELLRFVLVGLCAVLLNQPEWTETFRPEEQPTMLILHDNTKSMETKDVIVEIGGRPSTSIEPISRMDALGPLVDPHRWDSLQQRWEIAIEPIVQSATSSGNTPQLTDLYTPLIQAPEKYRNLRAVVLASDGDWNDGLPPIQAATQLRRQEIPILCVPVGSPTRLPDVELLSFDVPIFGIVNKPIRIPFTIDSSLPREFVTNIVLTSNSGPMVSKEVRIAPMGRTSDVLMWTPPGIGEYTLTLDLPKHPMELLAENNQRTAPIAIREEKLHVLVVESYPRWEYRYLRNALSRDPGVDVSCLLFHPGLSKPGGGNRDYLQRFPQGLDELAQYDVVFLGDVGLDDGQLTIEQCRLLKGLVEHQASGLVFMPGWQGRQLSLFETALADLYPVFLDPNQPMGWGSRTAQQFELTETGRRSLLTKLADTPDENIEVWETLPGFQWYAPVLRARPGTEVLCVHKEISNEFGRLPLLATRSYGAGKVLFMGTDGAWRWRKGVEDLYHYRFWGQVVRWMAYQRHMARGETMRLYYNPEQPQVEQTVTLNANVMEANGEPVSKGEVTARIVAPSGKSQSLRFSTVGDEWGAFAATFVTKEAGSHQVTLACKETKESLTTTLFVQGNVIERIGKPARPEVLEELARVSRGKVLGLHQIDEIVQTLAALPEPPATIRRVQLWSHPVMAGLFIFLLGVFWIGRKLAGLV